MQPRGARPGAEQGEVHRRSGPFDDEFPGVQQHVDALRAYVDPAVPDEQSVTVADPEIGPNL